MNEITYYTMLYGMYFLYGLIAFIIFRLIFKAVIKTPHSNWNTLIDGFNYSSEEFYKRLKVELHSQGIKKISTHFVFLKEGGVFSSRRTYLRVEWKSYQYDICAAPFGKGFFISWWLLYKNSFWQIFIAKIPFIGSWLDRKWFPITYYKIDTASMFMTYAQNSVLKVIDVISKEKGLRSLTENERKPILKDIFKR